MKSNLKHLFVTIITGAALSLGAVGCKEKSEVEKAADSLNDAAKQVGKSMDKTADAVKDAAKDVKKEVEKAVEKK